MKSVSATPFVNSSYTFYTAKGNINTKYRSPMYSILDTIRK